MIEIRLARSRIKKTVELEIQEHRLARDSRECVWNGVLEANT